MTGRAKANVGAAAKRAGTNYQRLTAEERKYIDGLLAQGYGVSIQRARNGRVMSVRVTEDGKFNESWCN